MRDTPNKSCVKLVNLAIIPYLLWYYLLTIPTPRKKGDRTVGFAPCPGRVLPRLIPSFATTPGWLMADYDPAIRDRFPYFFLLRVFLVPTSPLEKHGPCNLYTTPLSRFADTPSVEGQRY